MLTNQELTVILRANGYKVTPQRLAVYEALAGNRTHPNAETLYNILQPRFPSMSFATVYKTVEILNKINVIKILNTGEDSFRYDADTSAHHHVQCEICGEVRDVALSGGGELARNVEEQSGYAVRRQQFYFFGVCPACSKRH